MSSPSMGRLLLWGALAIPALLLPYRWWADPALLPGDLLHPTGEWSARLIILALMVTPLSIAFPGRTWVRWLLRHRRAFGLAAFGYALLHLILYVLEMQAVEDMLAELGAPAIWTGWLAFLCLVPIALTSNDASMRALKTGWKRLQRMAYPAAILTLVHWALVHDGFTAALLYFAPLAALQLYRVARSLTRPRTHRHPLNPEGV